MFDSREVLQELGELVALPDARDLLDQVEVLERLKSAAAAAQARLTAAFDDRRHEEHPRGTRSEASLGAEIGLARHDSPHRGRRSLGLARALVDDLPSTLAALERGDISERRAEIIADESQDLTREDRLALDAELGPDLPGLGDRDLLLRVQRIVMRIDGAGAQRRRERARTRRHVAGRRLSDGMAQVTGVVSDIHARAITDSLRERALLEQKVYGEHRSLTQLIADLFVERLTGQTTADSVPLNIDLVVTAETLLGEDDEPGEVVGVGPVPASVARGMAVASPEERTRIRRLFRFEETDRLVAMESGGRTFRGLGALLIRIRDQLCRSPYCNGDIKHADHVRPVRRGGTTSEANAQGLCEACNYVKEEPGWRHRVVSEGLEQHTIETTTPAGHTLCSKAPDPPRPATRSGWVEARPGHWVRAA